jgi:hypothetical protein
MFKRVTRSTTQVVRAVFVEMMMSRGDAVHGQTRTQSVKPEARAARERKYRAL